MSIGARLLEERTRMGLSQPAFAGIAGTTKQTLYSWEKDNTTPTAAQLSKLGAGGVDVLYVLTGQRSRASLAADEAALLDNYRNSSTEGQRLLRETSAAFSQHTTPARRHAVAR